jgi:carboxyl-terminal processing protease
VDADTDPSQLYGGPLVLLTSRFSASASEILSGALQDYGRALVVGDSSTFGKGTVQSVLPLARLMDQSGLFHSYDPGALKVTIRKFYRPGGASTQMRGVESNIVLPSTTDFSAVSESAMKDPLPWDAVPASSYTRDDRVSPYVEVLRQRSAQRIASSKDFAYLADDIARLRGSLEKKTVSLNEAERRKEMADAKARQAERDKERATRKAQPPRSYEITLKNAGSPGLPPPLDLEKKKAPKSAAKGGSSAPDDANDPPEPGSREDVILTEAQQILSDYIDLQRPKAKAKVGAR